jgi:hypothetical protein
MQFKCIVKNLQYGIRFLGLNISTLRHTLHVYFQARCIVFFIINILYKLNGYIFNWIFYYFSIYKNQAEFQLIFRIPSGFVSFMKIGPSYLREHLCPKTAWRFFLNKETRCKVTDYAICNFVLIVNGSGKLSMFVVTSLIEPLTGVAVKSTGLPYLSSSVCLLQAWTRYNVISCGFSSLMLVSSLSRRSVQNKV